MVVEAIYEAKRNERTDDVATKVSDLLAAAEREGDPDEQR
jgi:hypothetical protein